MYLIFTVPAVKPVTTPSVLTDAVPVPVTIDQVPPDCELANAGVILLTQTEDAPSVFADNVGNALIVNVAVLLIKIVEVQPVDPNFNDLIVIVVLPEFAKGPIEKLPVPAVETVIEAVDAVAVFELVKS